MSRANMRRRMKESQIRTTARSDIFRSLASAFPQHWSNPTQIGSSPTQSARPRPCFVTSTTSVEPSPCSAITNENPTRPNHNLVEPNLMLVEPNPYSVITSENSVEPSLSVADPNMTLVEPGPNLAKRGPNTTATTGSIVVEMSQVRSNRNNTEKNPHVVDTSQMLVEQSLVDTGTQLGKCPQSRSLHDRIRPLEPEIGRLARMCGAFVRATCRRSFGPSLKVDTGKNTPGVDRVRTECSARGC